MTDQEGFLHGALGRERAAEDAMYRGDPGPFKELWSQTDDVTLFGAFGPCKTGWTQVTKTMDWVPAATATAPCSPTTSVSMKAPILPTPSAMSVARCASTAVPP
jgi:hypothetical protein